MKMLKKAQIKRKQASLTRLTRLLMSQLTTLVPHQKKPLLTLKTKMTLLQKRLQPRHLSLGMERKKLLRKRRKKS